MPAAGSADDAASTARPPPRKSAAYGVVMALVANLLFAASDALAKALTARYPVFQVLAMNVVVACAPLGFVILRDRALEPNPNRSWLLLALRGGVGALGAVLFLFALSMLPMAEVDALAFTSPLLLALISAPVLGERVEAATLLAAAAGFVGVIVMIRPGISPLSPGHLLALGCVFTTAAILVLMRLLAGRENRTLPVAAVLAGLFAVSAPGALLWGRLPDAADLPRILASGLLMGGAQFAALAALRFAPAASVAPVQYTMLVWGLVYGMVFFGDPVRPHVLAGSAIVIASSLYILRRERLAAVAPRPDAAGPLRRRPGGCG